MSTVTRSMQDMLPFDLELPELPELPVVPVYDEQDRQADRELCQRYFKTWCRSFGNLERDPAGHSGISFAQFQAAADRLAQTSD